MFKCIQMVFSSCQDAQSHVKLQQLLICTGTKKVAVHWKDECLLIEDMLTAAPLSLRYEIEIPSVHFTRRPNPFFFSRATSKDIS